MKLSTARPLLRLAVLLSALTAMSCGQPTLQSRAIVVKIAAFNDFHGNLNPPTTGTPVANPSATPPTLEIPTGGIEYLGSLVAQLKAQNPLNVVVAAGDLIGGSPLVASLFHHEPTI